MKHLLSVLTSVLIIILTIPSLQAQDKQPFVMVEYMKVKPGMHSEYRACEDAWKLIHEHRLKEGFITGWDLERVIFPSGTNTEYDYLTITHYKNWEALDAEDGADWNAFFKILPEDKQEIADKAESYRDIVKREIWTGSNAMFTKDGEQAEYRVENYMKIPEGGMARWEEMEMTVARPILEKSMNSGGRAGWVMTHLVAPRGGDLPYHVSTVDFYASWKQLGMGDGDAWEDAMSGSNGDSMNEMMSSRIIVKSEIRRLVESVK